VPEAALSDTFKLPCAFQQQQATSLLHRYALSHLRQENLEQALALIEHSAHLLESIGLKATKPFENSRAPWRLSNVRLRPRRWSIERYPMTTVDSCLPGSSMVAVRLNLWIWALLMNTATAEFMTRFFKHLSTGEAQASTLAAVKREFASHALYSHPKFWAGFVLNGV
jgi:hypothetical protein